MAVLLQRGPPTNLNLYCFSVMASMYNLPVPALEQTICTGKRQEHWKIIKDTFEDQSIASDLDKKDAKATQQHWKHLYILKLSSEKMQNPKQMPNARILVPVMVPTWEQQNQQYQ